MRICDKRQSHFCDCSNLPCDKLKHLDKRYREKYNSSPIENLKTIKEKRIENFLESEYKKWVSDKGILCMHDGKIHPIN